MNIALDLSDASPEVLNALLTEDMSQEVSVVISSVEPSFASWFPRRPEWVVRGETYESRTLALMADFCASQEFETVRYEALRMLDREDYSGSFRMVDREALLHSYCLRILEEQLVEKIDLYIADVTPHEFVSYLWWQLSAWRGLKVLFFQPCGIGPFVLPRLAADVTVQIESIARSARVSERNAREFIDRFFSRLEGSEQAKWVANQKASDSASSSPTRAYAKALALLSPKFLGESLDFDYSMVSDSFRRRLWFLRNLMVFNSRRALSRALNLQVSREEPNTSSYVLFPLHYEPERTSRPEGLGYSDQFKALMEIRKFVPDEVSVLVKEHYSQVSGALRGYLGRSRRVYSLIGTLPNTFLVKPDAEIIPLVKDSKCVFTLTGTIGIEAPFLGVPAVYLGAPWWGGIPGTFRFGDVENWDFVENVEVPSKKEHIGALQEAISGHMIYGLAGESIESSERRWGSLPDSLFQSFWKSVGQIVDRL